MAERTLPRARSGGWARELAILCAILLGSLAVRVYLATTAATISRDTCVFVWYAQELAESPRAALRGYDQHPLYPLSIWGMHALADRMGWIAAGNAGWRQAAVAAALTAGMGSVLLIWVLTRHLFGPRIGLIAALLGSFLPELARYSSDGLSDPLHLFFYLAAVVLGAAGLARACPWRLGAGGVSAGLAYLVRPEGAAIGLILAAACVVGARVPGWPKRLGLALLTLAAFCLPATPYMLATGKIVQKKPIREFLPWSGDSDEAASRGIPPPPERSAAHLPVSAASHPGPLADWAEARRYAHAFMKVLWQWIRACRVVCFLLAVVGFIAYGWPKGREKACWLMTAAGAVHFAVLLLLVVNFRYEDKLSLRHTLLLGVLVLPWSAAAIEWIVLRLHGRRLSHADQQQGPVRPPPVWLWAGVPLAVVASTAYWLLRPLQTNTAHLKSAGQWLAANRPRAAVVMTTENRVPFYADKQRRRWPEENGKIDELLAHLDLFHPDIVALDLRHVIRANPRFVEELASSPQADRRLRRVASFAGRPEKRGTPEVILFDVIPAPASPRGPEAPQ